LGRIRRGRSISDDELTIQESSEDIIKAKVRDYVIELHPKERILKHDCDDWRKGIREKRLCKHIVKVLFSINPEKALEILEDINENKARWSFHL